MSHDLPSDAAAKAVALVQMIADQTGGTLSNAQLAPVIRAVAQDLQNGADKAAADEERLTEVETQTRVLSEAVMAMTETADSPAPAVKVVKDEM